MKIWKCLAVSKMIAASNSIPTIVMYDDWSREGLSDGSSNGASNAVRNEIDTCREVPVYPGLGSNAFSCIENNTKFSSTCKTTCNSGDIAHNCSCKDGQNNAIPCKWTNVLNKCLGKYQIKEFVIEWVIDSPESISTFTTTTSETLKNIFEKWIAKEESENADKG